MSMLSSQAKALRSWADQLSDREGEFGVVVRALVADLREAADTIESLSDKLQGVMGTRYCELFGTPERAARTLMDICDECDESACSECKVDPLVGYATNYDVLLEWLNEADNERKIK